MKAGSILHTRGTRRTLSLLLALTLILVPFALTASGCRKAGTPDGGAQGSDGGNGIGDKGPQVLTHVFRPTAYSLPEGYSVNSGVIPRYDPESGALTCFAVRTDSREDENGVWQYETRTEIVTATESEVLSREELTFGENENLSNGVFTSDGLIWLTTVFDPEAETERCALYLKKDASAPEDVRRVEDVQSLFDGGGGDRRSWFFVDHVAVDGDGFVYLSSERSIVVLTPELEKSFSLDVPDWINSMAADGDGTVWVTGYFGNGQALRPVDRETRAFGDPLALPNGVNELFFGPGHAFYYRSDEGLFAADCDENGDVTSELVFSFLNSDVSRAQASILAVYGPEAVLMTDRDGAALYRKVPDVDLSAITVLRLATTVQADYQLSLNLVAFNKSHTDVRIVAERYEAEDPEDYYGGERRLAEEMVTGAGGGRPDLVLVAQNGPALTQIVKRGLFADLNPYAERPGLLNRGNIMGCVLRTFTDREGRLFGLTDGFTLFALLSTDEILGEYAGRDSWTPEELLDFAESLPADCLLTENLTRETAASTLLGPGGYASFIADDGKSCSFDSPLFVRFLNYAASLPTLEEYRAKDPAANLPREEKYQLYHEGKIALKQKGLHGLESFLEMELDFGTKDWRLIGQPTRGDCGTPIRADSVYVITAPEGERADLAWEALEALLAPPEYRGGWNIPALVSEFEKEVEEYYTYEFTFTYSGHGSWGTKNPENERPLDEPGIRTEFTAADERRIRDILDNHCGVPFALEADPDVTAIVDEEISTFLGGLGSAEDCAKKIQSRVSILLAEKG